MTFGDVRDDERVLWALRNDDWKRLETRMNTGDSTTQRIINPQRIEVKPVKNNNPAIIRDASVTEAKLTKARLAKEQRALKRIAGIPGGTRKRKRERDWEEDPAVSFSHAYNFNILTGWWMRILRTREACIYLGIRPGQLRQLIERGEIPTVNDAGTPTRVDIRDLDAWIARSKRTRSLSVAANISEAVPKKSRTR